MATRSWYLPEFISAGARLVAIASPRPLPALPDWPAEPPQRLVGADAWADAIHLPGVTAVIVATPNHLHAEVASAALAAGRHVLVEKPLCTDARSATSLERSAAGSPDLVAWVAYKHRYLPSHQRAKELVEAGTLGRAVSAHAVMAHHGPRSWSPGAEWFFDPNRAGGGTLLDLGVHKLDSCCWLLDDEVALVNANIKRLGNGVVESSARATFTLAGGCELTVETSWDASVLRDELRVEFERGWIYLSGKDRLSWRGPDGVMKVETLAPPLNGAGLAHSGVTTGFIRAVVVGGSVGRHPTFATGAMHVRAVLAAYAASGETVELAAALA